MLWQSDELFMLELVLLRLSPLLDLLPFLFLAPFLSSRRLPIRPGRGVAPVAELELVGISGAWLSVDHAPTARRFGLVALLP